MGTVEHRTPRALAAALERAPRLPAANGSIARLRGWGILGVGFATGHVFALRRFPASSLGRAHSTVWQRDPDGRWRYYVDVEPELSCVAFLGEAASDARVESIAIVWTGARSFTVSVPGARLAWAVHLDGRLPGRILNHALDSVPESLRRDPRVLSMAGLGAGAALRLGDVRFHGRAGRRSRFVLSPRRLWKVDASVALLDGANLGPVAPVEPAGVAAAPGDLAIPRRGLFVFGDAYLEPTIVGNGKNRRSDF